MGKKKVWVEVCLISGRGLRRSSSLWKLQWYAVGWIHPGDKYCTKIDTSGTPNPLWKTGFSTSLEFDPSQDLALHVEVYSRDPIFLRESLFGSATIAFKEFLEKYSSDSPVDEVGSFQLRKRNSNKPLGFVDVSIRISQQREHPGSSYLDADEGFNLDTHGGGMKEGKHDLVLGKSQQTETSNQMPIPPNYPPAASYQPRPPLPLQPPPPSNVGYIPNFFSMTSNNTPSSYMNMPTAAARGVGMGLGAGALAAGAVIFGDDYISAASRDATDTISTYHPF